MSNSHSFKLMLEQMNCAQQAQFSTINHHVDGLHYICLARCEQLTVKIYLMENPHNPHSGFLVHPHSHRYSFDTVVLAGSVAHLRFTEIPGDTWDAHVYNADTGEPTPIGQCDLTYELDLHSRDGAYFVSDNEIHTLQCLRSRGPMMLGLVQYADTRDETELYLPSSGKFVRANSRRPTVEEMEMLRDRCLYLLGQPA